MSWTKVLAADQLPTGKREVVKVGERNILLLNHEGQIYAVARRCPHMNIKMTRGKITEDGTIVCPMHRSSFDLKTGCVKEWTPFPPVVGKMIGKLSPEKPLPVFPIKVEEGSIWVDA
ncbi:Rieske (2Fe-2S) domain protein [Rippkaea orientalis PCC 8801]|uniref:Rieske (2Fe-2S) domain protein n=1 Tax=Rippkaea orientalis (strain PCC 8801 / RF-1) TaxID=41431 RepID=B7K3M9_RIPO1|nr:Rieske (2Fe-2S) protein [Rippkaea orientalis]ACK65371.1 Rieske (2Fe-2S) domain protein [Rippkaea orientalis PCC 8801]